MPSTFRTEACPDRFFVLLKKMTLVNFSVAYISQTNMISVKTTWESMQLCSVISKFVVLS